MSFLSNWAAAWSRLSVRLPALIALFSAITGLLAGGIALYIADGSFVDTTKARMEIVRNERTRAVGAVIEQYRVGLAALSTRYSISVDLAELSQALVKVPPAQREAVVKAYTTDSAYPVDARAAVTDAGDGSAYSRKHKEAHERFLRLVQLQALADAAHKLKSSARSVGANALADSCAALEAAGKKAEWSTIDALAPRARQQMDAVARYVAKL